MAVFIFHLQRRQQTMYFSNLFAIQFGSTAIFALIQLCRSCCAMQRCSSRSAYRIDTSWTRNIGNWFRPDRQLWRQRPTQLMISSRVRSKSGQLQVRLRSVVLNLRIIWCVVFDHSVHEHELWFANYHLERTNWLQPRIARSMAITVTCIRRMPRE